MNRNEMNLNDLIELLVTMRDEIGGEEAGDKVAIRVAVQPSWPLAHNVAAVSMMEQGGDEDREHVLWIAASDGHPYDEAPYAPRAAWQGGMVVNDDDDVDDCIDPVDGSFIAK